MLVPKAKAEQAVDILRKLKRLTWPWNAECFFFTKGRDRNRLPMAIDHKTAVLELHIASILRKSMPMVYINTLVWVEPKTIREEGKERNGKSKLLQPKSMTRQLVNAGGRGW